MALDVSDRVAQKLREKHGVSIQEVIECFANRCGPSLLDTREDHKTIPPTKWFIAETDRGRKLKVVYIWADSRCTIKTAYPPSSVELEIYRKITGVFFT